MRLIIAGSREKKDKEYVLSSITSLMQGMQVSEVVSGGCRGVDQFGEEWAQERGIPVRRFLPDWEKHGKAAGPIRNREMAEYGDYLIAFWDGQSKGTRSMINEAKKNCLSIHVVTRDGSKQFFHPY